jgi:K+-transporting ATPase ATPase C chain
MSTSPISPTAPTAPIAFVTELRRAVVALLALTLITGVLYPLLVTGIAQAAMPGKANGSLVVAGGKAVGSQLIGQTFTDPKYLWSRPSATSPGPYDGTASSGSNLGPTNPALTDAVTARVAALHAADPGNVLPIPVDLVTASASGLDPHLSPAAALYQVPRIARVRHLPEDQVRALVDRYTDGPLLGIFGEPAVNVLEINLALDGLAPGS